MTPELHLPGWRPGLHTPAAVDNRATVALLESAMRLIRARSVNKSTYQHTDVSPANTSPLHAMERGTGGEEKFTMTLTTIQRPGREPVTRLEGLPCPCCGKPTRVQWLQPSLLPDRPAHRYTHCENPDCAGYYMTNTPEDFTRKYGVAS